MQKHKTVMLLETLISGVFASDYRQREDTLEELKRVTRANRDPLQVVDVAPLYDLWRTHTRQILPSQFWRSVAVARLLGTLETENSRTKINRRWSEFSRFHDALRIGGYPFNFTDVMRNWGRPLTDESAWDALDWVTSAVCATIVARNPPHEFAIRDDILLDLLRWLFGDAPWNPPHDEDGHLAELLGGDGDPGIMVLKRVLLYCFQGFDDVADIPEGADGGWDIEAIARELIGANA